MSKRLSEIRRFEGVSVALDRIKFSSFDRVLQFKGVPTMNNDNPRSVVRELFKRPEVASNSTQATICINYTRP